MIDRLRDGMRLLCGNLILAWLRRFGSRPFPLTEVSTLIVAPHPDDETLGCGGLIALKRARGTPVHVVVMTDGGDAQTREGEARAALAMLGVAAPDVTFLGGTDGHLDSLTGQERHEVVSRLASQLTAQTPLEVFVPHRADVHVDHEATYRLVQEAISQAQVSVRQWEYAIWLLWWKPIPWVSLPPRALAQAHRLALGPVRSQKRAAIAEHRSQLRPHILPRAFLARFDAPTEIFFGSSD